MTDKERIAELERENERLVAWDSIAKRNYESVCVDFASFKSTNEKKILQLQKENSLLKEELESISEILPHHVGRNETGVSIIDDVKDLLKENSELRIDIERFRLEVMRKIEPPKEKSYGWEQVALEELKENNKLKKENSELKGKIVRAIEGLEFYKDNGSAWIWVESISGPGCQRYQLYKIADQTLSELKGEKWRLKK